MNMYKILTDKNEILDTCAELSKEFENIEIIEVKGWVSIRNKNNMKTESMYKLSPLGIKNRMKKLNL